MRNNQSSMTALVAAFGRAYHTLHDEPKIFDDFLAKELLTEEEFTQISGHMAAGISFFHPDRAADLSESEALKWVVQTQLAPTPLARAKYCEDMLNNAITLGIDQYVILGAGMDTFAFRNAKRLQNIHVFEVDHPDTQQFKIQKVKNAGWDIPANLHFVAADFTTDNFIELLLKSGFDTTKRTFFSWLGVTYYLSKDRILDVLQSMVSACPKGSSIVFDFADENLFHSEVKRVQNMLALAESSGEPMQSCFSFSELEKLMEQIGLLIYEHLTPQEIEDRYFSDRSDDLHSFEHIHYVLAVVQ